MRVLPDGCVAILIAYEVISGLLTSSSSLSMGSGPKLAEQMRCSRMTAQKAWQARPVL